MKNKNIGSSFNDFLEEEGILEECKAEAFKRITEAAKIIDSYEGPRYIIDTDNKLNLKGNNMTEENTVVEETVKTATVEEAEKLAETKVAEIVEAIEKDAGEPLPGLKGSIEEMEKGKAEKPKKKRRSSAEVAAAKIAAKKDIEVVKERLAQSKVDQIFNNSDQPVSLLTEAEKNALELIINRSDQLTRQSHVPLSIIHTLRDLLARS